MCLRDAIWNVYNSELFKIDYMSQRPWNKYCIRISKSVKEKSKAFASVKFLLGKRKGNLTTQGVDSASRLLGIQFSSVIQLCPTLQPHELQHIRPPCPSPTPRVQPNPGPLCQWCHPTISSSVTPFSSCPQSFPASGSFQMSQLSASAGQSIGFQLQHQSL